MAIDERLERLTERHEALTQHVEALTQTVDLLTQAEQRSDKRVNRLYEVTLRIGPDFAERLRKLEERDGG